MKEAFFFVTFCTVFIDIHASNLQARKSLLSYRIVPFASDLSFDLSHSESTSITTSFRTYNGLLNQNHGIVYPIQTGELLDSIEPLI